jgi:ABC-2 type transport system ATP-binding protein
MMSSVAAALAPSGVRARDAVAGVAIEGINKRFAITRSWRETVTAPFARTYMQALTNVNCTIAPGEFFGILGPNGAGKTTLFKILATLITPDTGRAVINGFDTVRDAQQVRRQLVPVVADERSLRWRLNAWENLRLYAVLYRVPAGEIRQRIADVLEVVGLANTGEKMVGQFSSGMKQRLLIARALLARPRVMLLDEPTRGLDPLNARSLRTFLKDELCGRQGCTVVLATHSADEAFHLCDRVGILDRGRILTTGRADDLSESFTDGRYQMWTRVPGHPELARLSSLGLVHDIATRRTEPDDWTVLELRLPGGPEGAARALALLVAGGMEVARFERVQLSLAQLIERVQERALEVTHA